MADPKALYQEVILDHNKKPRNFGVLENPTHHAEGHNPLCGDHLRLTIKMTGEQIEGIGFDGESCAICKASASMMTTVVKGKSRGEAETLVQEFRDMAMGKLDPAGPHHMGRLTVFAGVRDLPMRVKCAILPWHTLHAALNAVETTSTEAVNDPMEVS